MGPLAGGNPVWDFGDQRWSQDLQSGVFDLIDFKHLGPPLQTHDSHDLARLVGARVSLDSEDRGAKDAAIFPGAFAYSPISGKALPEPPSPGEGVWIPPFANNEGAGVNKPPGPRLTEVALSLPPSQTLESRPHVALPPPPPGDYQFLVGPFTTRTSGLVAIEFSKGLLYRWLSAARIWEEITPRDSGVLGESSLTEHAWGMVAPDPIGSTRVFVPTDNGLVALVLNLITPGYETEVAGLRCVGAPALWHGQIYVPMVQANRRVAVHGFDLRTLDVVQRLRAPVVVDANEWMRPIVERRQITWMSSAGQLLVKQRADGVEVSFIAWEPGFVPRFDLGSPYVSADGRLWQQCFRDDPSGGRFTFVQLGRTPPEVHETTSPRLSTGSSSFKLETLLGANPWLDPEEGMDSQANEVVIPLLESLSSSTILCARVPSTGSVDSVFASEEPCLTTFELWGEHEILFARERMTRPWRTRPFVFDGCLFLYHPDLENLPGWRMS